MKDWNPEQYLKFKYERTQPSKDLISRIRIADPISIIDIGCGPGNSTQALHEKWPKAEITGLDNSEEMIKKAKIDYPKQKWVIADASKFEPDQKYDIVFSNATYQWIPNHEILFPKIFDAVKSKGAFAFQVPANNESPLHKALFAVSADKKWNKFTKDCPNLFNYQSTPYYYNLLVKLSPEVEMWETTYCHILSSHIELIEWYKGSGMRPFLEKLPDDESRKHFENDVLELCKQGYNIQADGKVIFPFKRIFAIVNNK